VNSADSFGQSRKWLLIGAFQQTKSVFIFTDDPHSY